LVIFVCLCIFLLYFCLFLQVSCDSVRMILNVTKICASDILIEEDFTVWRDSERCSSVLLGIYLGESLGESC
jgi:hypothetical protein